MANITTLPKYTIKVKNSSGVVVANFASFRKLKFGKRLNNYGMCEFDISVKDTYNEVSFLLKEDGDFLLKEDGGKFVLEGSTENPASDIINLRKNTIEIYEHTFTELAYLLKEDGDFLLKEDGGKFVLEDSGWIAQKIWAGEQAIARGDLNSAGNNWVTIYNYTWFEQLRHRYTAAEVTYTTTDAGAIAWALINTSQTPTNGSFGITQGTIEASTNRTRTYYNQNIMEAIINLANVLSGFDFDFSDDKAFNVYVLKGSDLTDSIVLEYGKNITSCTVVQDFSDPINRAIILGEAAGETALQRVERNDATQQAAYKIREIVSSEMTVSELSTLQDKGDAILRKYDTPLLKIDIDLLSSPFKVSDFSLGDLITLKITDGYYAINEDYRIFEWELEYTSDEKETLSLTLGKFTI